MVETYDRYRPRPPQVVLDVLLQLAQTSRARMVVDIGCGSGLSALIWAERAETIVGIEPNTDLLRGAETARSALPMSDHIRFQTGLATDTQLPDGCADIVTCSQSFHWMDPQPTLTEVARILRLGGVFAAYGYLLPPTINWEVEKSFMAFESKIKEGGRLPGTVKWSKKGHMESINNSGMFRFTKELWLHDIGESSADKMVGLATTSSRVSTLLQQGLSEEAIGLKELRDTARRALGDGPCPCYFSYHVRIGIK